MKFGDIKLYTWLKYNNQYWSVRDIEKTRCRLLNESKYIHLTPKDFETNGIKIVKPPVFQKGEQVFGISTSVLVRNQLATIVQINHDETEAFLYQIKTNQDMFVWVSPFEIQKINY